MFAKIFIDRPKLSLVISLAISLLGLLCIFRLPISEYPEVAPPCIYVWAQFPGASSQVMADSVASIIEEECNGIEDMIYFNSNSENSGMYFLTIYFKPGKNSDIAQVNVQNAVARAQTKLPSEVLSIGVTVAKRSTDMLGLYVFTADLDKMSYLDLANYVRINVKDRFSRIQGISSIDIQGERNYSMRVWLDSIKLAGLGLEASDITAALRAENIIAAIGTLGGEEASQYLQLKVDAPGRRNTEQEFADIVVKTTEDGRQVTLGDVARIELGAERYTNNSFWGDRPSVALQLYRQTGANAVDVIDRCNKELDEIRKRLPDGVEGFLGYDPTEFIRESIKEIVFTLVLTLVLVVLVTYFFLQDWRATIVPAVAIPVSLLGTFFMMSVLGFSINVLSMFGLILVVGLLVDDGVIVVENATRLIEQEHLSPYDAAVKSMVQTTGAILASTFVMVAIFAPLSFFGGIVGTIYMQFSVTMCVAIIFSAINALTLSPALCALLLRPHDENRKKNFVFRFFEWLINLTRNIFLGISGVFVRRGFLTALILAGVAYLNSYTFGLLSEGFIPNEDKGALLCEILLPQGATLKRTNDACKQFQDICMQVPGVRNIVSVAGYSMLSGLCENVALGIIQLDDWSERRSPDLSIDAIRMNLMQECAKIPQGSVTVFQPPAIMGLGATDGISFMLSNQNGNPRQLEQDMGKLLGMLNDKSVFPNVAYAFSSYSASTPQLFLDVDPQAASAFFSSKGEVFNALQMKIASLYVNDFNRSGYSFKVKIQSDEADRSSVGNIDELTVRNHLGQQIPISELATIRYELGAQRITRFNMAMCCPMNVILVPGASTGDVMKQIESVVDDNFSKEYRVDWTDMSFHQRGNEGKLAVLLMLALAFGYLFLAAKYESWTVPFAVLLFVLFATLGALVAMKIAGLNLDVFAQLSLIMLLGLASKISILTVEFSKQEREAGVPIVQAALNGARQRYRAIMMTAGCFIAGVIPLMTAHGAGSVSRQVVGICTGWGMIAATVLGVGFLPPIYALVQRSREFVNKNFWGRLAGKTK